MVSVIREAVLFICTLVSCAPPPRQAKSAYVDPATCIGGLCVRPDHAVARKVRTEKGSKCMIVAWDGDGHLPPTAKMGITDDTPARPGVFLAVEVPSLLAGVAYRVGANATAMGVRVDPGVRFADQRLADHGDVILTTSGDEMHVRVRTVWGTNEEVAIIIVSRPKNTCGMPVSTD